MIQHDSASNSFHEKHSVVNLKPTKCLSRIPSTYTLFHCLLIPSRLPIKQYGLE